MDKPKGRENLSNMKRDLAVTIVNIRIQQTEHDILGYLDAHRKYEDSNIQESSAE